MIRLYVTYGFGSNLGQCFSIVEAETEEAAREKIEQVTRRQYAFVYIEKDWAMGDNDNQQTAYGLREVPLQAQRI